MYLMLQNNARAKSLLKSGVKATPSKTDLTSVPSPPDMSFSQPRNSAFEDDQHLFKPQFSSQHESPKMSTKKQVTITREKKNTRYSLGKYEAEGLKESWFGVLQPGDPFDVVGSHYRNISEACFSREFWERCLEEIQMTNIQIEDTRSFLEFYSKEFAAMLNLVLENINDLERVRYNITTMGKCHLNLLNSSDLYFELFRISFLSTLMDSFADAFTVELQTSWRKLLIMIFELMYLNGQNSKSLKEIEEVRTSLHGNDSMSLASISTDVLDSSYGSSIFTTQDSASTLRTSATTRSPSTNTTNTRPMITSFYTRPLSLSKKTSLSSLRSKVSTTSKMKSSDISISDSSHSITSSITTAPNGQKLYKGKPIPLFVQQDLQKTTTQGSGGSSLRAASQDLQSHSSIDSNTKKSKASKFFNSLLFPTGNMGPLIP